MTSEDDGYFKGIQYTTLLCTFIQAPRKIIINLFTRKIIQERAKGTKEDIMYSRYIYLNLIHLLWNTKTIEKNQTEFTQQSFTFLSLLRVIYHKKFWNSKRT